MPSLKQNARLLERADQEARHVWNPHDPKAGTVSHDFSLDRQIARARRGMGEAKWIALKGEW